MLSPPRGKSEDAWKRCTLQGSPIDQIFSPLVGATLPRFVVVACVIPKPVSTDYPATSSPLEVSRRAVVSAKIENDAIAGLHCGTGDLVVPFYQIPLWW